MTTAPWPVQRRKVLRDATGIGLAVGAYGLSYGALATTSGLSVLQTCALSVLTFTGGSQFALVGVLGSGGSAASGVAAALLLGSRNTLYGLRLAPTLQVRGARRAVAAHLTIDESTAMAVGQDDDRSSRLAFWATGLTVFVFWNIATLLGAVGATALGDPKALGLDAAVGAAFLALLWPRLRARGAWVVALLGASVALALTPLVSPGLPILAAGVVAVAVGMRIPAVALPAQGSEAP